MYAYSATTSVSGCKLSGNSAHDGGGISNRYGRLTVTNNSIFSGNTGYNGDGIENGGTLTVSGGSTLSGNSAAFEGGGIENIGMLMVSGGIDTSRPGTATITNSALSGNSAYEGGDIYIIGGALTVSGSTLSGNTATFEGGAIFNSPYGTVTVKNSSSIIGNIAPDGGDVYDKGVVYLASTSMIGILNGSPAVPI
jgi:hypothetical protein